MHSQTDQHAHDVYSSARALHRVASMPSRQLTSPFLRQDSASTAGTFSQATPSSTGGLLRRHNSESTARQFPKQERGEGYAKQPQHADDNAGSARGGSPSDYSKPGRGGSDPRLDKKRNAMLRNADSSAGLVHTSQTSDAEGDEDDASNRSWRSAREASGNFGNERDELGTMLQPGPQRGDSGLASFLLADAGGDEAGELRGGLRAHGRIGEDARARSEVRRRGGVVGHGDACLIRGATAESPRRVAVAMNQSEDASRKTSTSSIQAGRIKNSAGMLRKFLQAQVVGTRNIATGDQAGMASFVPSPLRKSVSEPPHDLSAGSAGPQPARGTALSAQPQRGRPSVSSPQLARNSVRPLSRHSSEEHTNATFSSIPNGSIYSSMQSGSQYSAPGGAAGPLKRGPNLSQASTVEAALQRGFAARAESEFSSTSGAGNDYMSVEKDEKHAREKMQVMCMCVMCVHGFGALLWMRWCEGSSCDSEVCYTCVCVRVCGCYMSLKKCV